MISTLNEFLHIIIEKQLFDSEKDLYYNLFKKCYGYQNLIILLELNNNKTLGIYTSILFDKVKVEKDFNLYLFNLDEKLVYRLKDYSFALIELFNESNELEIRNIIKINFNKLTLEINYDNLIEYYTISKSFEKENEIFEIKSCKIYETAYESKKQIVEFDEYFKTMIEYLKLQKENYNLIDKYNKLNKLVNLDYLYYSDYEGNILYDITDYKEEIEEMKKNIKDCKNLMNEIRKLID